MNLDKPARILFGGIFAGSLIYGLGVMNMARLQRRVQELQKACVAETEAEAKKQSTLSALASIFSRKMTCDPVELATSDTYSGIQGQLAAAERDVLRWDSWPQISGIAIAILSTFLGCGISFCDGFANFARPFSANSQTKARTSNSV